jgi:DNA-directed RNA polymerase specialized sigma24 family protein
MVLTRKEPRTRTFNPGESTDLRRRRRRDLVERLLERATCLPVRDLALLQAAYHDGRSAVELSMLTGTDVRSLRRQLRRLAERVLSQEFLFVLRHRDSWPPTRRRVATACILHGRPLRCASRELGISLHTVRQHYTAVVALFEAAKAARAS